MSSGQAGPPKEHDNRWAGANDARVGKFLVSRRAAAYCADLGVTPEIIEAGTKAYDSWQGGDDPFEASLVCYVFQAMLRESEVPNGQGE